MIAPDTGSHSCLLCAEFQIPRCQCMKLQELFSFCLFGLSFEDGFQVAKAIFRLHSSGWPSTSDPPASTYQGILRYPTKPSLRCLSYWTCFSCWVHFFFFLSFVQNSFLLCSSGCLGFHYEDQAALKLVLPLPPMLGSKMCASIPGYLLWSYIRYRSCISYLKCLGLYIVFRLCQLSIP